MINLDSKINDALIMAGLSRPEIRKINDGATIFGSAGLLDSLRLVRLVSAISTGFEELDIDIFDMMVELDVETIDAFASRDTLLAFLERVVAEKCQPVA